MKKTLVILFGNDTMISVYPSKVKALLPIGNIPCLSICIKSFIEALKTKVQFLIITSDRYEQEVQTEISRWHPSDELEGITFDFELCDSYDNRNASILYSMLQKINKDSFDYVFISDCSFPLLGNEVIKMMFEKKDKNCYALIGNFEDQKFSLSRRLLDGVYINGENSLEFNSIGENNKIYPYYFMNTVFLTMDDFSSKFSKVTENINYYRLFDWKPFLIPTYFMKFEGVPFLLCNDRIYLDNLYWKKKNTEHLQYINNIWLKWIDANNRLGKIEKKIEKLKSFSRVKEKEEI